MIRRFGDARTWLLALGVIVALTWLAHTRPSSEAPMMLAVAALSAVLPRRTRLRLPLVGEIARHRELFVCTIIASIGYAAFGPTVRAGQAGYFCDWGQNIALVREIATEWAQGRPTPAVLMGVAGGDPTIDLYATLPHQVAALISLWLGGPAHAHHVTMAVVMVAWIGAAVGVARLALRFSAWPVAILAGLACLWDSTEMFQWSVAGTWYWGLFPSTCGIAVLVNGLPWVADLIERPPTRAGIALAWLFVGLGAATHPIALLMALVVLGAGVIGTAFSRPERRTRWGSVVLHVGIALGLGAFWWLPATTNLMLYANHFGNPQIPVALALERSVNGGFPQTSFGALLGVSVFTLLAWRRGSSWTWLGAWLALSLYMETLVLDLGLSPSPSSVRIQCFRTTSVAMPLLYAAVGAMLSSPARVPYGRLKVLRFMPALAFAAAIGWLGTAPFEASKTWAQGHVEHALGLLTAQRITNRPALDELLGWFREQAAALPPGQYARVTYECEGVPINEVLRIATESGLPVVTHGRFVPIFLEREQFHATTPENLRRWAVRWSIGDEFEPSGDPATERRFGDLRVREIPSWDGSLVHVVRGEGTAHLAEIDDAHLAIDVEASAPVLVEIGIPYFPRWRGVHDGAPITPCGRPVDTTAPTLERVLSAWLPPGRTVLRPDGALPSDGNGWPISAAAIALAFVVWPRRNPLHVRVTSAWSFVRGIVVGYSGSIVLAAACVGLVALPLRQGVLTGTARALRYGGVFPAAHVEVMTPEGLVPCTTHDFLGHDVRCSGGVRAMMVMTHNVYDQPIGWPLPLPGIWINAGGTFETVFHGTGTWAPGAHWLYCGGACSQVGIVIDGVEQRFEPGLTRAFTLSHEERDLEVHVHGGAGDSGITIVRQDAVDIDRTNDVPACADAP